ncbi:hypothetical protein SAMN05421678_110148 [Actinopolymorpha cephalotaxi]|uniref:DUF2567 domain-containing protein n=1 Tax=Actinopolymorpha cephalotaxi TaxID=504797 RepID=A0A1I2W8A7_9ACTN|nr:hypothetical protein [Actinopolymorpha cephalotaxi]NYH82699.1 hypothetical protein [Actinopolymorpha cephalotaxi]SFG97620.1 hypothetical protein SAMN05421678_110148 [Actinopolymorpha cephalotaxi]
MNTTYPADASAPGPRTPPDRAPGAGRAFWVVAVVLVAAGAIAGLVWAWTAPSPHVAMTMTELGPFPNDEEQAARLVSMDGWYAALGAGTALVLGTVLATLFLRHGLVTVAGLLAGSVLAAFAAVVVGSLVANGSLVWTWSPHAAPGTALSAPLTLHAYGVLVSWPLAALAPVIPLVWSGSGRDGDFSRVIHSGRDRSRTPDAPMR